MRQTTSICDDKKANRMAYWWWHDTTLFMDWCVNSLMTSELDDWKFAYLLMYQLYPRHLQQLQFLWMITVMGNWKNRKMKQAKKKKKRRYNFSDIFDQHIHVLRLFLLALGLADFWLLEGIWSSAGLSSRCSFVLVDSWVSVSFAWYLNDVFWACVGKIVLKGCIFVFFFLFSLLFLLCFGTQICSNPLLVMVMTYLYSSFTLYVYDDDLYIRKKEEKNKKRIDDFVIVFWNLVVWYLCVVRGQDAIIICLFSTNYE